MLFTVVSSVREKASWSASSTQACCSSLRAFDQMRDTSRGKVIASMMYATARFNAWVSACGFDAGREMAEEKE
jgi:hypothetical protein